MNIEANDPNYSYKFLLELAIDNIDKAIITVKYSSYPDENRKVMEDLEIVRSVLCEIIKINIY